MPSFARSLEQTLHTALANASIRRHEFATIEHLLLALTEDPEAAKLLEECRVPLSKLREDLVHYLDTELDSIIDENVGPGAQTDPSPTKNFQVVVQSSILDIQKSGLDEINGAHLLLNVMALEDSYAAHFLIAYDVTRIKLMALLPEAIRLSHIARQEQGEETLDAESVIKIRTIFRNDLKAVSDGISPDPVLYTPNIAKQVCRLALDVVEHASLGATADFNSRQALVTIGLYGPWGSGKSTLLRAIGKQMSEQGLATVSINTWMWDESQDVHSFVLSELLRSLSANRDTRWRARLIKAMLFWRAHSWRVALWCGLIVGTAVAAFSIDWKLAITSDAAAKGSLLALATAAIVAVLAKPLGTLVEGIIFLKKKEHTPKETLSKSYAYLDMLTKWNLGRRAGPLVFLFDDLDRCSEEGVVSFIQSIHLLTASGSICVVACDEDFVSAAIYSKFKSVAEYLEQGRGFGRRFLEKIVQLPFRLPEVTTDDLLALGLHPSALAPLPSRPGPEVETSSAGTELMHDTETYTEEGLSQIRLSAICGQTLALVVEPCRLQIRQIKMLSNMVKLYSMIFPPADEASAERLAMFIVVTYIDERWIPHHYFGAANASEFQSPLDEVADGLKCRLGDDRTAIEKLYRLCGTPRV